MKERLLREKLYAEGRMRGVNDILKVDKGEIIQEDRDEIAKQKQKQIFSG